jgi:hypothetical protein
LLGIISAALQAQLQALRGATGKRRLLGDEKKLDARIDTSRDSTSGTGPRVVFMPIAAAMRAILAELDRGRRIQASEIETRLPGHAHDDLETAVMLLEGEGRIIVERETGDAPNPYSFSAIQSGAPPTANPGTR